MMRPEIFPKAGRVRLSGFFLDDGKDGFGGSLPTLPLCGS
jgi:hypothetical protein